MGLRKADFIPFGASPKSLGERLAALVRGSRSSAARTLRHLETLPLGPRRSLYLVECDGERFLITAGGVGLGAPAIPLLAIPVPPVPMFAQLRGAYSLGKFSALWRTIALSPWRKACGPSCCSRWPSRSPLAWRG